MFRNLDILRAAEMILTAIFKTTDVKVLSVRQNIDEIVIKTKILKLFLIF